MVCPAGALGSPAVKLSVRQSDIPTVLLNLYNAEWDPDADDDGKRSLLDAVYVTVDRSDTDEFYGAEVCLNDWFPLVVSDWMIERVTELDIRLDTLEPEEQTRLLAMLRPPADTVSPIRISRGR